MGRRPGHLTVNGARFVIKRTIEISREPAHLCLRHRQLVLRRGDETVASIPCEDLGMVLVDHPQATYSHAALSALMESDAVVVICGGDHLPQGVLVPFSDHTQVVWRIQDQAGVGVPAKKQLWRQIVRAKILAQARNLTMDSPPRRKLEELARTVRSGDAGNHEAQAARAYWSAWLVNVDDPEAERSFRRDPDEGGLNAVLNYGYAVIRAAVARAIVGAGLHPALGLHHSNRGNGFCLADDLMEPLRPTVDARARELYWAGETELDQPTKARLLELLAEEMEVGGERGPLMVGLHRYVASLVRCYEGSSQKLEIPTSCN